MIIVKTQGGLGNQLFQFACGRALALRRDVELRVWDGQTDVVRRPDRPLRLWDFAVSATPASEEDVAQTVSIVYENPFGFLPAVSNLPDGILLDGFWQSEQYFIDATDTIRTELSFRDNDLMHKARLAVAGLRQHTGAPVVAVHIRRGDYVLERTKGIFHVLSLNWFRLAMARFPQNVVFLVFSDDLPWCRANLHDQRVHYASGESDLSDFALMRACDHYIISNSTYSWWGAWLSDNASPVVIGPEPSIWFGPLLMALGQHDASNIIPARWITQPEL